jgi:CheY-like chemotaxis protein
MLWLRGRDAAVARILVIDDEPDIRQLLRTIVEREGHEALEAGDTVEAAEALGKLPDAIFIDVAMPGETGAEFLIKLRQHPSLSRTPAMFVTAHADRIMPIQRAGLAGPRVIQKPFRSEEVAEALRTMLRSKRRRLDARVHILRETIHVSRGDEPRHVAKNVSLGGVFVHSKHKRPIGDRTVLKIYHRGAALETRARVTHSGADGVGYAFVDPSLEFIEALSAAIQDLLSVGAAVDDRRSSARLSVSAAIAFSDGKKRTTAQLADLSATGAFVQTPDPPAPGARVYIYLPGRAFSEGQDEFSEVRGCLCNVVRCTADGFGVRFRDPSAEFQMAVDTLMKQNGRENPASGSGVRPPSSRQPSTP